MLLICTQLGTTYVSLQYARKSNGRTRNLPQISPELDMFVDVSGKRNPESTVGLEDLRTGERSNAWPVYAFLYWTVVTDNGNDRI